MTSKREKKCFQCNEEYPVMFRCRGDHNSDWEFYCKSCMQKLRALNSGYQYGGTWKKDKN